MARCQTELAALNNKYNIALREVAVKFAAGIDLAYRVRNYRGRVSNFNQSEVRKHCFLAPDWSKFVTLPL